MAGVDVSAESKRCRQGSIIEHQNQKKHVPQLVLSTYYYYYYYYYPPPNLYLSPSVKQPSARILLSARFAPSSYVQCQARLPLINAALMPWHFSLSPRRCSISHFPSSICLRYQTSCNHRFHSCCDRPCCQAAPHILCPPARAEVLDREGVNGKLHFLTRLHCQTTLSTGTCKIPD